MLKKVSFQGTTLDIASNYSLLFIRILKLNLQRVQTHCVGSGEEVPHIDESGSAVKDVVPMRDHVKECKTWAKNSPESCENPNNPSFVLMNSACMESCNVRKAS